MASLMLHTQPLTVFLENYFLQLFLLGQCFHLRVDPNPEVPARLALEAAMLSCGLSFL